jgi:hypothetical protein
MAITTYDPKQVVVSFLGNLLTGYAAGSFVTATRAADTFTLHVGADGEAVRTRSANRSGTVTVRLVQTSPANDFLAAAAAADELSGAGVGPIFVKDLGGRTLAAAQNAWVKKPAVIDFGADVGTREWAFETDELIVFPAGS